MAEILANAKSHIYKNGINVNVYTFMVSPTCEMSKPDTNYSSVQFSPVTTKRAVHVAV